MKNITLFFTIIISSFLVTIKAQETPTQTIKGQIIDKDTRQSLPGAEVYVTGLESGDIGEVTDLDGKFRIENVPIGRRTIIVSFMGYEDYVLEGIILNSAKELVLNIELIESAELMNEVVVTAKEKSNRPLNKMITNSSRSFSVEESKRYPGSIADPSRMSLGFPGVQLTQDNSNDIVIRANSSIGLLWKLEGVEIANPNHFATIGGSGGGISVFSASVLDNSDFSTGAFPAEYGNALSGVFDMKFRKGNNENREYTIKAGLLGLDFATEGPFKKGESSYLFNYRYSTLGILSSFGVYVVNPRTGNNFQDLSFNTYFPTKSGTIQVWGIGGLSSELNIPEADQTDWKIFDDQTQYDLSTNMGATGITISNIFEKNNSYLKTTFAATASKIKWEKDSVDVNLNEYNINNENHLNGRYILSSFYNKKFNSKFTLKTGITFNSLFYNLNRSYQNFTSKEYINDIQEKGYSLLLQYYIQARYTPKEKITINGGLHTLFFALNNTYAIEPRLGIRYHAGKNSAITFSYGLHSQILPLGTYFIQADDNTLPNKNLDLLKAHHIVLGYDHSFPKSMRLNVELYYQYLFNVPVIKDGGSTFWMLNNLKGYGIENNNLPLASEGTGKNMGIDITFEKYLSNNLFFLLSGSLFQSTYSTDGTVSYSTRYDSRFSSSIMIGKEFIFKKNNALTLGFRNLYSGGLKYTPGDPIASAAIRNLVEDENFTFENQLKNYWRMDIQAAYRKDKPKYAWSLILDIQNIINYSNELSLIYDFTLNDFIVKPQSGIIPVISFQVDF